MSGYGGAALDMTELWAIVLIWAIIVGLGILVGYYGVKIFLRTRERSMGFLAAGFLLISGVAGIVWFLMYFAGMNLYQCELGSTGFTAIGFASILYSIRSRAT